MAKVFNTSRYALTCNQIRKTIAGGRFVTVSNEQAKRVPQNGIFRVELDPEVTPEPVAEKTSKRSTKKVAAMKKELEDNGGGIPPTSWFAGDPNDAGE